MLDMSLDTAAWLLADALMASLAVLVFLHGGAGGAELTPDAEYRSYEPKFVRNIDRHTFDTCEKPNAKPA